LNIGSRERDLSNIEENLRGLTTSIHKLELSKSKVESDSELFINKLWEDYEITIPQAERFRTEIRSISEASKRVNDLKNSIKSLGDVNVNSIEEYKKVIERYEFLKKQEKDLKQAKKHYWK
jgi:chromosome segregation protein